MNKFNTVFNKLVNEDSRVDLRGSDFNKNTKSFDFYHSKTPTVLVKRDIVAPDFDIPAGTKLRPLPCDPGHFKFEVVESPDESLVGEISMILMDEIL
jgi:hypothetical protein